MPKKIDALPEGSWQAERSFPSQTGSLNNALALSSMYSFTAYKGHGCLYLEEEEGINSFDLFVNNRAVDTSGMKEGIYKVSVQ